MYKMKTIIVYLCFFLGTLNCSGIVNDNKKDSLPDDIKEGILSEKKLWISSLSKIDPGFELGRFNYVSKDNFSLDYTEDNFFSSDWLKVYEDFIFPSPDGLKFIDIYSTKVSFIQEQGKKLALFEIDTKVHLIDKELDKSQLIAFSGTEEHFQDCYWLDNNTFTLMGVKETLNGTQETRYVPFIWVYNIRSGEKVEYLYSTLLTGYNDSYFNNKYQIESL